MNVGISTQVSDHCPWATCSYFLMEAYIVDIYLEVSYPSASNEYHNKFSRRNGKNIYTFDWKKKSILSRAMVIITNWKFWINAYENLLTVEDYSDAQASRACSTLITVMQLSWSTLIPGYALFFKQKY